jgi:hypothetical protein
MRKLVLILAAHAVLCALALQAQDQDSPSLGDLARHVRAQKQQKDVPTKDASSKDSSKPAQTATKPSHVITNEELPQHAGPAATAQNKSNSSSGSNTDLAGTNREQLADAFKSRIHDQKAAIAELQSEITRVSDSVQYVGGNCVSGCVEWNEHQQQKQQQVERMKSQLEDAQHRLDEMQESARKQGFGGSVSDPE